MSYFSKRNSSTVYIIIAVYSQNKFGLLYLFSLPPLQPLLQVIVSFIIALILGPLHTAVDCVVDAGRYCRQKLVVSSQLLVNAGQLPLVLTCLMRPAADRLAHGFWTDAYGIAHRSRLHSRNIALRGLPLAVLHHSLDVQPGPPQFFCEMAAQLFSPALLFNSHFIGFSTRVF